jgi:precorrin-6B methylase 2
MFKVLVLGGSPSGTNTITVDPNDAQKLYFVKNGSGQDAVFSQGSGANVTVPNGESRIIYCDGGGASAAVTDMSSDFGALDASNNLSDLASAATALTNLGLTATATEINYNDITTLGTVEASKTVTADSNADVTFGDNDKIRMGADGDLLLYHNGSNSYVQDAGTGGLVLQANNTLYIQSYSSNDDMIKAISDGAVTLYYDNAAKIATTSTGIDVTGNVVADGCVVDGTLDIEEVFEKVDTGTSTTGTLTIDVTNTGVTYLTANQTANRTINFSNVNATLGIGKSVTSAVLITNGATPYYLSAYQVDGSTVTPKWSGGSAPTAGNASSIDVYTFTIIKTADATFTVLASQTQYA